MRYRHSAGGQAVPLHARDAGRSAISDQGRLRRREAAFILEEDPELAEALGPQERDDARRLLCAPVVSVARGPWSPPAVRSAGAYGLLVLDGLMVRTIRVNGGVACELLGPGDITRPWERDYLEELASRQPTEWQALQRTRLALLDERITALLARWPALSVAFSGRLLRRVRTLSYLLAVSHVVRVEEKLLIVLWHIAGTWGKVTPRGISIHLPLTHEMLGQMIGAKRPSVSTSMKVLQGRGLVARTDDGYLLLGDPASGLEIEGQVMSAATLRAPAPRLAPAIAPATGPEAGAEDPDAGAEAEDSSAGADRSGALEHRDAALA
jgi:CRP/FNR family transcriptional regulator, cyclic AMP receptor protein